MENTLTSIWQSSDEVVDYDELEPETYQRIAEAIGVANPVLDIGCGEGKLANFLAMTLGKEVRGIDISNTKLAKAREEAKAQGVSHLVQFMEGDATHLNTGADQFFGAIVNVYTLHELDDAHKTLKELRMVLEAGGKLVMVDFIKGGNAEKLWGERYYTPQEIESMLQEAGFSELAMELVRDDVIFGSWVKI